MDKIKLNKLKVQEKINKPQESKNSIVYEGEQLKPIDIVNKTKVETNIIETNSAHVSLNLKLDDKINNNSNNNIIISNNNTMKENITSINDISEDKNVKKIKLDYKGVYKNLKKFLLKNEFYFLCKKCNCFLLTNYSQASVNIYMNRKIKFLFNIKELYEEKNKIFEEPISLSSIRSFLLEQNLKAENEVKFKEVENSHFIYNKIVCFNCNECLGKFIFGTPKLFSDCNKKIVLEEEKLTAIKCNKLGIIEKINFFDYFINNPSYKNLIEETLDQFEDKVIDINSRFYDCQFFSKQIQDIKNYLELSFDDLAKLDKLNRYIEFVLNKNF